MCKCNPTIKSPYCDKCRPSNSRFGVNPISEAEVYMSYNRIDQAIEVLEQGLQSDNDDEFKVSILLMLLACHTRKNDKERFVRVIEQLCKIVDENNQSWITAVTMANHLGLIIKHTHVNETPTYIKENVIFEMKQIVIRRLIDLGIQTKLPGFDDSVDKLNAKFNNMPDDLLLTFFELIVVQSHKDGFQ